MALQAKVVSFQPSSGVAGTTQAITGVGFTPKAIIFFWGGSTNAANEQLSANTRFGMGFGVTATDRGYFSSFITDGAATSDAACTIGRDGIIAQNTAAIAQDSRWDLVSMDSDGFTLIVDDQAPAGSNVRVHALCLGGGNITNAVGGSFNKNVTTGTQAITGLGFKPDIVLFFTTGELGPSPDNDEHARFGFGVAKSAAEQSVLWGFSQDALADSNTEKYMRFDECIFNESWGSGSHQIATFVSQDSGGFTVNWITGTASPDTPLVLYLAIKGGSWKVGNSATLTSLASIATTGYGFPPAGVLVLSANATAQQTTNVVASGMAVSVGAADSPTSRGSHADVEPDASATMDVDFGIRYDEVYQNIAETGPIVGLMDIQSFDSNGITFVMDDADPTTRVFSYLAMGFVGAAVAIAGNGALAATVKKNARAAITVSGNGTIAVTKTHQGRSAVTASGNGAVVTTDKKGGLSVVTASTNGSVVASTRKGGQSAVTETSNGAIVIASEAERLRQVVISGVGAFVVTGQKAASVLVLISGDGLITTTNSHGATAQVAVSGDGSLSSTGTKAAFSAVSASTDGELVTDFALMGSAIVHVHGDGELLTTATTARFSVVSVEGDGSLTVEAQKNAYREVTLTVDGVVQVASYKDGQSAVAVSGDGSLSASFTEGHASEVAVAGDGAVVIASYKGALSEVTGVSGGGLETGEEFGRQAQAQVSGDGNITTTGEIQDVDVAVVSGDGSLVTSHTTARFSVVTITGDGLQPTAAKVKSTALYSMRLSFTLGSSGVPGVLSYMDFEMDAGDVPEFRA